MISITPKMQERINVLCNHIERAFVDLNKSHYEDALGNFRKGCEAICRIYILKYYTDITGEKIIYGELDKDKKPMTPRNGNYEIPLLNKLLIIIKAKIPKSIYYRFEDIRFGGNNAAHDPLNTNDTITTQDVDLCKAQFVEVLKWFYVDFLKTSIPDEIQKQINSDSKSSILDIKNSSEWDLFLESCDSFSSYNDYILISPPHIRDCTDSQLSVFRKIEWSFVFDFNVESKINGLYKIIETRSDRKIKPITIKQISEKDNVSHSSYIINWLFTNGIKDIPDTISQVFTDWRSSKFRYPSFIEKLINDFFTQKSRRTIVLCMYDDIKYTRTIVEKITEQIINPELVKFIFIYDNVERSHRLREEFEEYNSSFFHLSISDLCEGFYRIKGCEEIIDKKCIQVPARGEEEKDIFKDISSQYISFLDSGIEIVYQGIEQSSEENSSENFYSGNKITWKEIANDVDVRRNKKEEIMTNISKLLDTSKSAYQYDLLHKPGSGGTTIARRIAYEFHSLFPSILVLKYKKDKTSEAIFRLSGLTQKPILAIVEAFQVNKNELRELIRRCNEDKKHVVFLYVNRILKDVINRTQQRTTIIHEKMLDISERDRFISKFLPVSQRRKDIEFFQSLQPEQCDVLDFSLSANEEGYNHLTLSNYIKGYLNDLPLNQLEFVTFSALQYYYTQKNISELMFQNLFSEKGLSADLTMTSIEEQNIRKLLTQEYDTNKFDYTEWWRPRYNRFSKLILQLSLSANSNLDGHEEDWKSNISSWSIKYINVCKENNPILTDEVRQLLKSLFFERNNEDLLGIDETYESPSSNCKFAQLIEDIAHKSDQLSLFKTIIDKYPDDAHFRGHFGRFLYEKAQEPKDFEEASFQISRALENGESDYNLWHLRGMCNRRKIEYIIRNYNSQEVNDEDIELIVKGLTEDANDFFNKSRELNPRNLHAHTAQIQMLIKVLDFGRAYTNSSSKEIFISNPDNWWYEEQLNNTLEILEEAKYLIELSTDIESSQNIRKTESMILACEGKTYDVLGEFNKSIDKFKKLSETSERTMRPYFRKMFVYSTLLNKISGNRKKVNTAWKLLSDYEYESIQKALENNILEQPENVYNIRLWLKGVRYSNKIYSIDNVLSYVKKWYDNSVEQNISHLEATYYRYVLHACKAISEGDSFSDMDVKEARRFIDECKVKNMNDVFSFEWFGKGIGLKTMINHSDLGHMKSSIGFYEDTSLLQKVKGIIVSISSRQQGKIRLDCGLDAFFVPAKGGFDKGSETTQIECYISFRYNGLHAWDVISESQKKVNIVDHIQEIEIEGVDTDIPNVEDILVEDSSEKTNDEYIYTTDIPQLDTPKIVGKIDLSLFDKYKKNKK